MKNTERLNIVENNVSVRDMIDGLVSLGPQEEPLYVLELDDVIRKFQNWSQKMPRVKPFYAVKCNNEQIILKALATLGLGFDCASKEEINQVLSLGVSPEKIIYANPSKSVAYLDFARKKSVRTMTFDNDIELHKIKLNYPDARLVIRICCDAERAQSSLGKKFGCDPFKDALRLIKLGKSLNLNIIGVSFHVGSGCLECPIYYKAIQLARKVFDDARSVGYYFTLLDIGGGFPGDNDSSIDEYAHYVNKGLSNFFPSDSVSIIAEPGRYFVASAYTVICNIQSKRINLNPITSETESIMYYINDGVFGSFYCTLHENQRAIPIVLAETGDSHTFKTTIWGPTCDVLDKICDNISLVELQIGDFILFQNVGAYTIPIACRFNGFPLPKTHTFVRRDMWSMLSCLSLKS